MRRIGIVVLSIVMLCGAFGTNIVVAQEATPADGTEHPLVGAWLVDTEPENSTNAPHLAVVSSDGTYLEVEVGGPSVGVWEATGDSSASVTFHFLIEPEPVGMGTVRGDVEVSEDGQSFAGTFTVELVSPDGTSSGEIGPGQVEATRITSETQGTPVGTFEEVFGAPPAGTPEATPAG